LTWQENFLNHDQEPVQDVSELNTIETDVLIVGGGPAGTSTALGLLAYSDLKVTLIERSELNHTRIGEHVSPSLFEILDYLKLNADKIKTEFATPSYGTAMAWGSERVFSMNGIYTTETATYQLDRTNFDFELLKAVAEQGGIILPRTELVEHSFDGTHWKIVLKHAERGLIHIKTRFLVDASGRSGGLSKRIGIQQERKDKLVGVGAFFQLKKGVHPEKYQFIESTMDGWWYRSILPGRLMGMTFFTDSDLASSLRLSNRQAWFDHLSKTQHLKKELEQYVASASEIWTRQAHSQITSFSDTSNFIVVGDAATSFDPVSSMGIGFAMSSGCSAARAIRKALNENDSDAITTYENDLQRQFDAYWTQRQAIYAREQRWSGEVFWERRREYDI